MQHPETTNSAGRLLQKDLMDMGLISVEDAEDVPHLFELAKLGNYDAQTVLYREGDSVDTIYVINFGLIKLINYLPNGRSRIVRLHNRGSVIGLGGLLGDAHDHTAMTISDATIYQIPLQALVDLKEQKAQIYSRFLEQWYEYLNQADTWITSFSTGTIRGRVARLVLFLSDIEIDNGRKQVWLLTSEEMAEVLGVTPESVSRVIAEFKRQKFLTQVNNNSDLFHCHIEALKKEAAE